MILFRYLIREVFLTLTALTSILLLIFMSNQFVRYLTRAASGQMPGIFIIKLMMVEMPNLLGMLMPLGLYIAFLVAYGRMYADNEMTVLRSCGYGLKDLLKHSLCIATVVAIFVGIQSFWLSPILSTERSTLLRTAGIQTLIKTIVPGRFRVLGGGRDVFYVENMSSSHEQAQQVFLARRSNDPKDLKWDIVWANQASAYTNPQNGQDYIALEQGRLYEGIPGSADFKILEFSSYKTRLSKPEVNIKDDLRTETTEALLPFLNENPQKAAELQWRLAIPIMVFTLTLVAVPLSRIEPRAGKYAKLLPAIILFIVYANFVFIARNWISTGVTPVWLGMWWLHGIVTFFGLYLFWRESA